MSAKEFEVVHFAATENGYEWSRDFLAWQMMAVNIYDPRSFALSRSSPNSASISCKPKRPTAALNDLPAADERGVIGATLVSVRTGAQWTSGEALLVAHAAARAARFAPIAVPHRSNCIVPMQMELSSSRAN
jgi:hypothetical protein